MQPRFAQSILFAAIGATFGFVACSDDTEDLACTGTQCAGGSPGAGGTKASGGSASGGTRTSGGTTVVTTGGSSNGGLSNGGSSNGGSSNGGAATGGTPTAGTTSTGGASVGGVANGGAAGSVATGGKANAGENSTGGSEIAGSTSTGGAAAGGVAGSATGGAMATGGVVNTAGTTGDAAGETGAGGTAGAAGESGSGGTAGTTGTEATGGSAGAAPTAAYCLGSTAAFCDDFEDGDAAGWTAINQTATIPGTWTMGSEAGYNGVTSYDYQLSAPAPAEGYHYNLASAATGGPWTDQTVSAWVKPNSDIGGDLTKIGICARATGTTNTTLTGYCLFLRIDATSGAGVVQLSRKPSPSAPTGTSIGTLLNQTLTVADAFAVGTWYKVAVQVSGSSPVTVTGFINGIQVVTTTDAVTPAIVSGYPALVTRQGMNTTTSTLAPAGTGSFDNVTLTSP